MINQDVPLLLACVSNPFPRAVRAITMSPARAIMSTRLASSAAVCWKTRAKNGENAFLLRVASVAKRECDQ